MKRWQSILLGIIISAATLYFAFRNVTLDTLGGALAHGKYLFLVPGIVLGVSGMILRGLRWKSILGGRMDTAHSLNILNASYLFNTILPLRLGEVVRAYLATRVQPPVSAFTALSSVVVERLTDLLAVV
ncbi:MAG TPA: lysylphosphatidylglycerol synthase domain-containing protein, partial [Aggregatilineales bacterium]|nr:lysylphosphatidylglycerol synthase domain-containing protein [Aggregatilineales bacterium]